MTVFVSAGHGLTDPGAVYQSFGEHVEACAWRNSIIRFGQLLGVPFEGVPIVPLRRKVDYINSRIEEMRRGAIAIEVHFNAAGGPGPRGCETLYAPNSERGELLAHVVQESLISFFPPSRGTKEAWYRQDRPHHVDYRGDVEGDEKPDYFCVATSCPAVIVEPEFIYERASIQGKREACCRAIAAALVSAHQILCGEAHR